MYVVDFKDREKSAVEFAGSRDVYVRWLVGRNTGARTFAMRLFEIKAGGIIPLHTHEEEHEIFVLEGKAKILGSEEGLAAKKGDVVFISSNQNHGFDNTEGKESFCFICVIPLLRKD
ncbi:MAG: cupin domain-containing protein [Promethearchaeota archaeon]